MHPLLRTLPLAGLLALLGGCATYKPAPLDPRAELLRLGETTVPSAFVTREGEAPLADAASFDLSDGLSEGELVAVALTLNPELAAERSSIGEADSLLVQAGLLPNPEVGVGYQAGISGTPGFNVDADLLFSLLRVGERRQGKRVARARGAEVRSEVLAREYDLAVEVRRQLTRVLVAEQVAELLERELSLREHAAALVGQQRDLGEANELDVAAARLEAAAVRRDRRQAEVVLQTERGELNRLLGLPPAYELRLTEAGRPLEVRVTSDLSDKELEETLLASRLDLRSKEAEYRRVEEELRLAVLRQYPRLRLGPSFSHEGESENFLGAGVSLELPIFDRNQGEIAQKEAERNRVRAEYTALLHRLVATAHAARLRVRTARAELLAQEADVMPLLSRSEELFRGAFEARELSALELVAAQDRALRTRRAYLETVASAREAIIELDAALGLALSRPGHPAPTNDDSTSGRTTP